MTLNKINTEKLNRMFRSCHALMMNVRPITYFIWMCDLDERKGIELGNTYRTRDSVVEFVKCIAHAVSESLLKCQQGKFCMCF